MRSAGSRNRTAWRRCLSRPHGRSCGARTLCGAVARGPAGGVAARGPYGGAAYRGPYGGTAVRGAYGGTVVTGGVYRPYYGAGAVAAGVAVGCRCGGGFDFLLLPTLLLSAALLFSSTLVVIREWGDRYAGPQVARLIIGSWSTASICSDLARMIG